MATTRMLDGVRITMTGEEEAAFLAKKDEESAPETITTFQFVLEAMNRPAPNGTDDNFWAQFKAQLVSRGFDDLFMVASTVEKYSTRMQTVFTAMGLSQRQLYQFMTAADQRREGA